MRFFLLAFLITSCASVPSIPNPIGAKNTFLTVETPGCSRAVCKIENKEGDIYFLNTPDTINISKSRSDFQVTCFIEEVIKIDTVLPLTTSLSKDSTYLNHPFECALTDSELFVKNKLEESYVESQDEVMADSTNEVDIKLEITNETMSDEINSEDDIVLTDIQLKAISQLDELLKNRLISEEIYNKEIEAIKNQSS